MPTVSETPGYIREGVPPGTRYFEPDPPAHQGFSPELRAGCGEAKIHELVSWTADRAREDEVCHPILLSFCPRCRTQS